MFACGVTTNKGLLSSPYGWAQRNLLNGLNGLCRFRPFPRLDGLNRERYLFVQCSRCIQMLGMHTQPLKDRCCNGHRSSVAGGPNEGTVQLFDGRSGGRIGSLLRSPSMKRISCLQSSRPNACCCNYGWRFFCFDLRNQASYWDM